MQKPERKDFITEALYDAALDAFITYSLVQIFDKLLAEQAPMDPEIAGVLVDNLWDLYDD